MKGVTEQGRLGPGKAASRPQARVTPGQAEVSGEGDQGGEEAGRRTDAWNWPWPHPPGLSPTPGTSSLSVSQLAGGPLPKSLQECMSSPTQLPVLSDRARARDLG